MIFGTLALTTTYAPPAPTTTELDPFLDCVERVQV